MLWILFVLYTRRAVESARMYEEGDVVMVHASAVQKRHTSVTEESEAAVVVSRALDNLEATVHRQVKYNLRIFRTRALISDIESSLLEPCWWTPTERSQHALPATCSYLR